MNRLAITKIKRNEKEYITYIALNENREFTDFQLYSTNDSVLGNIYIGKVEKIVENIQAVFLKISDTKKCFLPLQEVPDAIFTKKQSQKKNICEGDELLVQIVKEAVKTKEAVASTHLTINGNFSLLTTQNKSLSVSKKLNEKERECQKKLLESICFNHIKDAYGIVTRTNSKNASVEELQEDIKQVVKTYLTLKETSKYKNAYTLVYTSLPEYIKRLQSVRDFTNYDGIYTDCEDIYQELSDAFPYLREQSFISFYQDDKVSLATLYNIYGNIDKLLSKQVWLKSGANIIIEQLETLTFIDINTAKKSDHTKKEKEDIILEVNKEAAKEVTRQIRLRNISGMILVDFINMDKTGEDELISFLNKELKQDVITCQFIDITKLGLVEITRKKVGKSLKEIVDVP